MAALRKDESRMQCQYSPLENPQDKLNAAVQTKNHEEFQCALQKGGNPKEPYPNSDKNLSVFEFCCSQPGMSLFIMKCLQWGCDVNHINGNRPTTPIILAAMDAKDASNIAALLTDTSVQLDYVFDGRTALIHLLDDIKDDNFSDRFAAIQLLVQHNANINITDERGVSPILFLLFEYQLDNALKRPVIDLFLQRPEIDLDSHWEGEARTILQTDFADILLPEALPESERIGTDIWMLDKLRAGDEESFLRGCATRIGAETFADFVQEFTTKPIDSGANVMQLSIDKGMAKAVRQLLTNGAEVSHSEEFNSIRRASSFGQHEIVKQLLAKCTETPEMFASVTSAIVATIPQMGKSVGCDRAESTDYRKCLDLLLAVRNIDLDRQDLFGNTALHLAVQYKQRQVAAQLLRQGASMAVRNVWNTVAIADIDADVLETHLDGCISESDDMRPGDEKYELILRYANFELGQRKKISKAAGLNGIRKSTGDKKGKSNKGEMTAIAYIAGAPDLRHLIKHPVIASFLFMKWNRLAPTFYLNFAVYSVFCVSLVLYILSINGYQEHLNGWVEPFVIFGVIYMGLRELISTIIAPAHYFRDITNYVSIVLIGLTVTLLIGGEDPQARRKISAFAILLGVSEFFVTLGSLPVMSISTYWVMLLTVTRSFLKSLMLYSIILGAFALSFFTLIGGGELKPAEEAVATTNSGKDGDDESKFNKFLSPGMSMMKTFVMMMGEVEASNLNFNDSFATYFVFFVFLLIVCTVMFNLLTGMAICDMQVIQADAELTYWIHRAQTLVKCEQIFGEFNKGWCNNLMKCFTYNIDMFPEYLPCSAIKVLPNDQNRVKIPTSNAGFETGEKHTRELLIISGRWTHMMIFAHCLRFVSSMESKIVKGARALIEARKLNDAKTEAAEHREAISEQRLEKIENRIELLIERLQCRVCAENSSN